MQPMQITFMALLLGHLLGDFPLQPQSIVKNKGERLWPLICHGLIHYILAWTCLLIFTEVPYMSISSNAIVIGYLAIHLLIDKIKHRLIAGRPRFDDAVSFLLDQTLHVVVLGMAALALTGTRITELTHSVRLSTATKTHILEVAIVYVAVVFGGGYLIRYLTKSLAKSTAAEPQDQLGNAGLYVGWIERFLVITAIAMQSPILVGLILTGKSIARYPEFKKARFAEYFLIGTLLSVSLSVLGGILLLQMLYGTVSLR